MKRLLAFSILLSSVASGMQQNPNNQPAQPQAKPYNVPSLRFLAAVNLGRRNPPSKELAQLPQELKEYAHFMQANHHLFSKMLSHEQSAPHELATQHAKDAQFMLMNACGAGILDTQLLQDLHAINPHLNLNTSYKMRDLDKNLVINATPLNWAISRRNIALIELLLKYGANANISDKSVTLPIICAVSGNRNYTAEHKIDVLKVLCAHGAQINCIDPNCGYKTPLIAAIEMNEEIEVIRFILKQSVLEAINHQDYQGNTAFSLACDKQNLEAMELLKQAGATINHINRHSRNTPLYEAALKQSNKVLAQLLSYGADVEIPGNFNLTPLIVAARDNNQEAVDLLLAHGAQIWHGNGVVTAPFIALENKHFTIAFKLIGLSETIPTRDPAEYFGGLLKLVKNNTQEALVIMNLLLRKGVLNSFAHHEQLKECVLHAATPAMKELIQNFRGPDYHALSSLQQQIYDLKCWWNKKS